MKEEVKRQGSRRGKAEITGARQLGKEAKTCTTFTFLSRGCVWCRGGSVGRQETAVGLRLFWRIR